MDEQQAYRGSGPGGSGCNRSPHRALAPFIAEDEDVAPSGLLAALSDCWSDDPEERVMARPLGSFQFKGAVGPIPMVWRGGGGGPHPHPLGEHWTRIRGESLVS